MVLKCNFNVILIEKSEKSCIISRKVNSFLSIYGERTEKLRMRLPTPMGSN